MNENRVCATLYTRTRRGGRCNKFNGSSCPDFFSPRARGDLDKTKWKRESLRGELSFASSISAFLAIRTFRPSSVYNPSLERKTSGDGAYFAQFAECHFKGRVIHGYEEKETLYDSRLVVGPCLPWIGRSTSPVSTWNVLSSSSWQTLVTGGNSCSNQRG